ncbi:hypothetical protein A1O3_06562 [Capronia epimyces CBS 606.96]|uniref:Uncharacterized protein n=1 Tax=Capronia epimyces CBS 606.96 TaxID=1182542 RepID=W9XQB7_9EURO|nr:uncharacterized protein A1O3_06562 [Capronia epimyces CBS 606.96]EXJ82747.1 hypothetical protein A1O3_06562 [Capronia epimyces CBS 606.96]
MRSIIAAALVGGVIVGGSASPGLGFDTFLGPVFEASPNSSSLTSSLEDSLSSALSAECRKDVNGSLMVSIRAASIFKDAPVFEYYHSTDRAQKTVNADTVFRIGSISKLFTTYTLLVSRGLAIFSRPIQDFVPELKTDSADLHPESRVNWSEVTVGALASHLAGISRDYNLGDLADLSLPQSQTGFPNLSRSDLPICINTNAGDSSTCDRSEFLAGLKKRNAVFETFQTPAYSNNAFRILGYVVEQVTQMKYATALQKVVLDPLGLKLTFASTPSSSLGAIPENSTETGWYEDLGDEVAAGGLFSSSSDLCSFGKAILTSKQIPRAVTRRWMKPSSHTSSLFLSIGMPWEIYRANIFGRIVDLYSKSGSVGAYNSWLVLVPDYGIVISVLVASAETAGALPGRLTDLVTFKVLREVAAREESQRFTGRYVSNSTTGQEPDSAVELQVNAEEPGLKIRSWISNGVDFLETADAYARSTDSGALQSVHLYPSICKTVDECLTYRAVFKTAREPASPLSIAEVGGVPQLFDQATGAWIAVDQLTYGKQPLDEFVFETDSEGRVIGVSNPGLRVKMARV